MSSSSNYLAWVLVGGFACGRAFAAESSTTQPDVSAELSVLRARVEQLEAQQKLHESQQIEAQDGVALTQAANDADRRSQLLDAQGVLSGYSNGRFVLQSEDGNLLLHPWLQFQFRNVTTYREDALQKGTRDDTQTGFEVRRLKFGANGNAFGPELTYFLQFAADRHTGNVALEMAWGKYQFDDTPFAVRVGQFKDPLDHEQLTASRFYPVADRSLIDDTFANGEGFIKGASFIYDPGSAVRAEAAFTGGLRNFNTNFQQYPSPGIPANWGAAGRFEYKAFGNWNDYELMSAYNIKHNTLVIGGGADYTETGHADALVHVVDAQYQSSSGLSFYAAYLGRYTARNTKALVDTYDSSARLQGSWAIDRHWEPYARYEYIHFNGREFAAHTQTNVNVFTAGANYYLYGTSARFTFDLSYLPNGSPVSDDGFGILADPGHNELVGRVQFQLVL